LTVKVPLAKVALPARPTDPTSLSDQSEGSPLLTIAVTVSATVVEFVKLPDVPVIVTVTLFPVMAVLLALSVRVLEVVAGFGLKDAVTPLGSPEADKVTPLLKPFCGVTVIVLVPLPPWAILTLLDDERLKFGPAVIVTETEVLLLKLPDMPVTFTVAVPVVAVLVAVRVMVLEPVAGFGLKDAVTPVGSPEADKVTLELKPFCDITVIALVPPPPCAMLTLLGDAERV
jgi:hypothetical protein